MTEPPRYRLAFKSSVEKDLRRRSSVNRQRLLARIESLAEEPIPREAIRLTDTERLYRVRVGDYRIIYEVEHTERLVTISYVRHRREAYRDV